MSASAKYPRIPHLPWTADPKRSPVVLLDLMADVCSQCPVRELCAAFVSREEVTGGYWAGRHRSAATWAEDHSTFGGDAA